MDNFFLRRTVQGTNFIRSTGYRNARAATTSIGSFLQRKLDKKFEEEDFQDQLDRQARAADQGVEKASKFAELMEGKPGQAPLQEVVWDGGPGVGSIRISKAVEKLTPKGIEEYHKLKGKTAAVIGDPTADVTDKLDEESEPAKVENTIPPVREQRLKSALTVSAEQKAQVANWANVVFNDPSKKKKKRRLRDTRLGKQTQFDADGLRGD